MRAGTQANGSRLSPQTVAQHSWFEWMHQASFALISRTFSCVDLLPTLIVFLRETGFVAIVCADTLTSLFRDPCSQPSWWFIR